MHVNRGRQKNIERTLTRPLVPHPRPPVRISLSLFFSKPKTDDSSDGGKVSDTEVRKRRERIERYQSERNKEADSRSSQLQANLQRFNEDRRKFELEKLKFLQEKRELDRMRLRRFDRYREEMLEEQRQKLQLELRSREQAERIQNFEAPALPPVPPTRAKTPVSPVMAVKKLLIIPKKADASSSEDERHNTSDEEKVASIRRRFSPRKPKRPRSAIRVEHLEIPKTPEPATSPEPESELPSDYPPETEPTSPIEEPTVVPDIKADEEMVLTKRKVAIVDDRVTKENENEKQKAENEVVGIVEKLEPQHQEEEKKKKFEVTMVDEKTVEGPKEKKRRRALLIYVEKKDDEFGWGEIFDELKDYWLDFLDDNPLEIHRLRIQANECLFYFGVLVVLCGVGGIIFRVTEGTFESQYKCGVKRVKRDFIDALWVSSHSQKYD